MSALQKNACASKLHTMHCNRAQELRIVPCRGDVCKFGHASFIRLVVFSVQRICVKGTLGC